MALRIYQLLTSTAGRESSQSYLGLYSLPGQDAIVSFDTMLKRPCNYFVMLLRIIKLATLLLLFLLLLLLDILLMRYGA